MLPFIQFSVEFHHAVEKRILEHPLKVRDGQPLVCAGGKAELLHALANFIERIVAGCVKLEGLTHEFGFFGNNRNAAIIPVIEVSNWWAIRPNSVSQLLSNTTLDVFGEVINVIFALAKGDVEHELSMRRWIKAERWKPQVLDVASIY